MTFHINVPVHPPPCATQIQFTLCYTAVNWHHSTVT